VLVRKQVQQHQAALRHAAQQRLQQGQTQQMGDLMSDNGTVAGSWDEQMGDLMSDNGTAAGSWDGL
jgi:hypothetical protein